MKKLTNCLSVSDHFVGLTFKGLTFSETELKVFLESVAKKFECLDNQKNILGKTKIIFHKFLSAFFWLTHFSPVSQFYSPCKRQKFKGFLTF